MQLTTNDKLKTSDIHERLYKQNQENLKKREEMYDPTRKERQEELKCSFSPRRQSEGQTGQTVARTANEFISDM